MPLRHFSGKCGYPRLAGQYPWVSQSVLGILQFLGVLRLRDNPPAPLPASLNARAFHGPDREYRKAHQNPRLRVSRNLWVRDWEAEQANVRTGLPHKKTGGGLYRLRRPPCLRPEAASILG